MLLHATFRGHLSYLVAGLKHPLVATRFSLPRLGSTYLQLMLITRGRQNHDSTKLSQELG